MVFVALRDYVWGKKEERRKCRKISGVSPFVLRWTYCHDRRGIAPFARLVIGSFSLACARGQPADIRSRISRVDSRPIRLIHVNAKRRRFP